MNLSLKKKIAMPLAAIGAAPRPDAHDARVEAYGEAAARLLNPALSAFNAGVRGYYFALAAAAWMFGPVAFLTATLGAVALLGWRQRTSKAARAIRDLRNILETAPPPSPAEPGEPAAARDQASPNEPR